MAAFTIAMLLIVGMTTSTHQVDAACDGAYLRSQCEDSSRFWAVVPINPHCCSAVVDAGASCMRGAMEKDLVAPTTILNYISKCPFPPSPSCQ